MGINGHAGEVTPFTIVPPLANIGIMRKNDAGKLSDGSDTLSSAATCSGDNVTDNRYQTQVLFNTLGIGSVWNAPATYGVEVSAKF